MIDPDKHIRAAEYLTGTFYAGEDDQPAVMSHDQAIALATAHALLAIAARLGQISEALPSQG
jgi:hypothetical protein